MGRPCPTAPRSRSGRARWGHRVTSGAPPFPVCGRLPANGPDPRPQRSLGARGLPTWLCPGPLGRSGPQTHTFSAGRTPPSTASLFPALQSTDPTSRQDPSPGATPQPPPGLTLGARPEAPLTPTPGHIRARLFKRVASSCEFCFLCSEKWQTWDRALRVPRSLCSLDTGSLVVPHTGARRCRHSHRAPGSIEPCHMSPPPCRRHSQQPRVRPGHVRQMAQGGSLARRAGARAARAHETPASPTLSQRDASGVLAEGGPAAPSLTLTLTPDEGLVFAVWAAGHVCASVTLCPSFTSVSSAGCPSLLLRGRPGSRLEISPLLAKSRLVLFSVVCLHLLILYTQPFCPLFPLLCDDSVSHLRSASLKH